MFGQVVIGPPGSGKTTYCRAMHEFLTSMGRKVAIVNLDPANDTLPYTADIDLAELVTLEDVMTSLHLGPNGGLLYCLEYLEQNLDWLLQKLNKLKDHYVLFDCPGQVELYTHHNSVRHIVSRLSRADHRLAAVHLVDSHYCSEPSKYIAVLLTSLCTMLQVELPHVNVLSKVDLIEKHGRLSFNLDFYTEVMNLDYLLDTLQDDPFFVRYKKLNAALVGVVQDYSLVNFVLLAVQDRESMLRVIQAVDKCNGYMFGADEERSLRAMLSRAVTAEFEAEKIQGAEKYIGQEEAQTDEGMG